MKPKSANKIETGTVQIMLPCGVVQEIVSMMVVRRLEWEDAIVACGRTWVRFTLPAGNGMGEADITVENVATGFEWGAVGRVPFLEISLVELTAPIVPVVLHVDETVSKPAPAVSLTAKEIEERMRFNRENDLPLNDGLSRVLVKRKSKDVDRFMRVVEAEFYKALTGKMMARLRTALERGLPFDEAVSDAIGARSGKRYARVVATLEAVA